MTHGCLHMTRSQLGRQAPSSNGFVHVHGSLKLLYRWKIEETLLGRSYLSLRDSHFVIKNIVIIPLSL